MHLLYPWLKNRAPVRFYLQVESGDYLSNNLPALERLLYEYGIDAGFVPYPRSPAHPFIVSLHGSFTAPRPSDKCWITLRPRRGVTPVYAQLNERDESAYVLEEDDPAQQRRWSFRFPGE